PFSLSPLLLCYGIIAPLLAHPCCSIELMDTGFSFFFPRLLAVAALVAANGFFVAVEFALVTARRGRLEAQAGANNEAVRTVLKMQNDTDLYIAAAQLGITIASLALGWIGDVTIAQMVEPGISRLVGARWGEGVAIGIGTVVSFSLVTFIHIVLGEQAPKTFAIRNPERAALMSARIMDAFTRIFRPVIWLLDGATTLVLRLFGVAGASGHHSVYSADELKMLVRESQAEGVLEQTQEEMLVRVFEFGERDVSEAMIQRTDIVGIERAATLDDLLHVFSVARHSRFPVYGGDLDNIVGVVAMKDVLMALAAGPQARTRTLAELGIIHPAHFVPDSRKVGDLFNEMRKQKIGMAIVIDEYGGTAGIVTVEELVEEVVGRVTDEWVTDESTVVTVAAGVFEVSAQARVDDINAQLGLDLPELDDYETLAGFILYQLHHIPHAGEEISYDNVHFTVLQMRGPKIEKVRVARQ
ncbi:MAG: hemolysin family protein, partial [Anaerolineae bacterium]